MRRSPTAHLDRLLAIAGELEQLQLPAPLLVFGSMGKGAARPGDIDVVCDVQGLQDLPLGSLRPLLAACRRHYGWVDAFIRTEGELWVRSDEATCWVRAKNTAGLVASMADAVPLAQVIELYRARVAELSMADCDSGCFGLPDPDEAVSP